jgi:uncharacterized protein YukE
VTAPVLLLPLPEFAAPTRPVLVDPDDFGATAQDFVDGQHDMRSLLSTLHTNLSHNDAAVGRDASSYAFAVIYHQGANQVLDALDYLHDVLGAIAVGLCQAGTDHSRADAISAADWRTADYTTYTVTVDSAASTPDAPNITSHHPNWLPAHLVDVWPCKDDDRLPAAAAAWQTARSTLGDIAARLENTVTALADNNSGDDLTALTEFWARYKTAFQTLDDAMLALSRGLMAYGNLIDGVSQQLKDTVIKALLHLDDVAAALAPDRADEIQRDGPRAAFFWPFADTVAHNAHSDAARISQQVANAARADPTITAITTAADQTHTTITNLPTPHLATTNSWQTGNNLDPPGDLDETEKAAVAQLATNGHVVREIEDRSRGRTPDLLVDGEPTEIKTTSSNSPMRIVDKIREAQRDGGQAPNILVDVRGTSVTVEQARDVLYRHMSERGGSVKRVTIWLANGQKVCWPEGYEGL